MPTRNDAYGEYSGGGWSWGKTDYAGNGMMIPNRPVCWPLARITDGTSHTVLVGEKAMDPRNYDSGTWYWDEPFFLGGSGGTWRQGGRMFRDAVGIAFPGNWGSAHANGAQFLFADGSVRSLAFETARVLLNALMTPNGGEPVPDF
jgi:prepilin-type processing-associated H-X9-DG protein